MSDTWMTKHHPPKAQPPHVETCDSRWDGGKCDCGADTSAPAGAQDWDFNEDTEWVRGYFRCRHCKQPVLMEQGHSCTSQPSEDDIARAALAPQPQPDRAALVEHLQARIRIAESAGVELARIRLDTLREIINALSAPAEATEPPSHTDLMVPPESVPDYSPSAHFGASLREARVAAGLSLRDAAALFGVTPERYGAVERGAAEVEAKEPLARVHPAYLRHLMKLEKRAIREGWTTPTEWEKNLDRDGQ